MACAVVFTFTGLSTAKVTSQDSFAPPWDGHDNGTIVNGDTDLVVDYTHIAADLVRVTIRRSTELAEARLTWAEAIHELRSEDAHFRDFLSTVLEGIDFPAVYWECPPVSRATAKKRLFEFIALNASSLDGLKADGRPFSEHLSAYKGQPVVKSFPNLGGDSVLLAPAQAIDNAEAYTHIASFFRHAPDEQKDNLWQALGDALDRRLQEVGPDTNVWVSTEGSGVYWLHMRLDPSPKYYHHADYRDPAWGLATYKAKGDL